MSYGPGAYSNITVVVNEGSGDPGTVWAFDGTIENSPMPRVYVGGDFTHVDGSALNGIARLDWNGALDTTFHPGSGVNGPVYSLRVQADSKVILGGAFDRFDFATRPGMARLNIDGTLDKSFNPGDGPNDPVYSIVLQPDGKILAGGIFTSFDHVRRMGIARLMTNGVLDTSFMDTAYNQFAGLINPLSFAPNRFVNSIALEANGAVLIGGSFRNLGGNANAEVIGTSPLLAWTRQDKTTRLNIARLIGGYTPGPGSVQPTLPKYSVAENAGVLAISLKRVDGRLGTVKADISSADVSAQNGLDYGFSKATAIWPEAHYPAPISVGFVDSIPFNISVMDNGLVEQDKTLALLLEQQLGSITLGGEFIPLGAARGSISTPVTILDDETGRGLVAFSSPTYTMNAGAFQMNLTGAIGQHFTIETSTNLLSWETLVSLTNTSGIMQYVDSSSTNSAQRFYRAVVLH